MIDDGRRCVLTEPAQGFESENLRTGGPPPGAVIPPRFPFLPATLDLCPVRVAIPVVRQDAAPVRGTEPGGSFWHGGRCVGNCVRVFPRGHGNGPGVRHFPFRVPLGGDAGKMNVRYRSGPCAA